MDESRLIALFYEDEERFNEALDALEVNRANAEMLLDMTACYDLRQLGTALLYTFDGVLTDEELVRVQTWFDERFE